MQSSISSNRMQTTAFRNQINAAWREERRQPTRKIAKTNKARLNKERDKFIAKYGALDTQKAKIARAQIINQEILSSSQSI